MHGRSASVEDATSDTLFRLRRSVFDDLMAAREARTVIAQANLTGVPERSLYRIRRGDPPSLANAMRIASALNVPFDVLFERVSDA